MTEEKIRTLQVRLGKRTTATFKDWHDNQLNPNESCRRIVEHFIRTYGTNDIDSDEVQIAMAKDLLTSRGITPEVQTDNAHPFDQKDNKTKEQVVTPVQKTISTPESLENETTTQDENIGDVFPIGNRGKIEL